MTRYIGLLRGINVGGRRSLPMSALRDAVASAGGADVTTYIQSGNVVFSHPSRAAAKLELELERQIQDLAGLAVPVLLRSAAEWSEVVRHNPYPKAEPKQLHVVFLRQAPVKRAFAAFDAKAFAPEAFVIGERHLYLYLPNGMGRAKLPIALERLGPKDAVGTARNWATVQKLLELSGSS